MLKTKDANQLKFEAFKTPFEIKMNRNNRWVRLSEILPWEELVGIYSKSMSDFGRPALDSRIAIGAMIIKTKLGLSDEETVEQIRENMYMQFFLGLEAYQEEPLFDTSLLVHIRERMGKEMLEQMNSVVVVKAVTEQENRKKEKGKENKKKKPTDDTEGGGTKGEEKPEDNTVKDNTVKAKEEVTHKGGYILDATVADQYIKYPTDVELLNDSRQKSEGIIDALYSISKLDKKPRTYRRKARKEFLLFTKKRKKTLKEVRKAVRKQLQYLGRNLKTIANLMDSDATALSCLQGQGYKDYLVIQEIYRQQEQMYKEKKNRCEDRIVSIHQPHVRPIVRGKQGKTVEFGSKVLAGITDDGYTLLPRMDWSAYNEGSYVIHSVDHYKKTFGYYPEVVIGDQIFITRANRKALEELGIRLSGKSLGRKTEEKQKEEKKKMLQEQKQRVRIEGKFGQGKNAYELNKIRMRKSSTSESMVSMIFFVMNIIRYAKDVLFCPFLQIEKMLAIFRIWYTSNRIEHRAA
ncbi:MAG: IS5 family transposase [Ignavibacteria bacterium]|nr:IS5 family transposase [Ignavibacteria bacterium]